MRFRKLKQNKKPLQNPKKEPKEKMLYARNTQKLKAFITDMFMIYAPLLYLIAYVILDGKDEFQNSQFAPLIAVSIYGIIYALLLSLYGQTPGKKAYSLKVVDAKSGKKISFLRALWRFVAFLFSATIGIGLLFTFFRKDKKNLHDLLAQTIEGYVVEPVKEQPSSSPKNQ